MQRDGALHTVLAAATLALVAAAPRLGAQGTFRLVVGTVTESRSRTASNETGGRLTLVPRLEGEGLGDARAFRIRVAAASDDTGRTLLPDEPAPPTWEENAAGPGLWLVLASPTRRASSVTVTGTLELWVPGRDPGAEVTLPRALARPGRPIVSPGLRGAGVALRLATREGASGPAVSLVGKTVDLEKVRRVRVLRADGTEVPSTGVQRVSTGGAGTLDLLLSEAPPADASLVLDLLTGKSVLEVPFELKDVPLP